MTEVQYEYHYRSQDFKSHRVRMSNYSSGRRREAEAISRRYPVGGSLTVLVDPRRPNSAVLEYGPTLLSSLCIGLGVLLGVFALLPFVLRWHA
jgi:hypothetical protein